MIVVEENAALMSEIVAKILKHNPHLKLGDALTGPVNVVKDGKIIKDLVDLNGDPIPGASVVEARTVQVHLPIEEGGDGWNFTSLEGTYLHPYQCVEARPADNLPVVGEVVQMINTVTFKSEPVTITQEMLDKANHRSAKFRYTIS